MSDVQSPAKKQVVVSATPKKPKDVAQFATAPGEVKPEAKPEAKSEAKTKSGTEVTSEETAAQESTPASAAPATPPVKAESLSPMPTSKPPIVEPVSDEPKRELLSPPTLADFDTLVDRTVHQHLSAVASYPPDTVDVRLFKQLFAEHFPPGSTHAIAVLGQYVSSGWLQRTWKNAAGRYSLTEAGQAHIHELSSKLA